MNEDQAEKLLALLERIALVMEKQHKALGEINETVRSLATGTLPPRR